MTEPEQVAESGGVLESARKVGTSLLGLLHTRFELIGLELREERLRAVKLLVSIAIGMGLAIAAVLLAIGTLALLLWRTAGYWGLVGLLVVLVVATVAVFLSVKRRILHGPVPFAATAEEFKKDFECLKARE